ncbi:MAG: ribosome-associated translation inhibitor RaiA [Muribaculaceae bacterium]|nr:ribosome-associated translation inhibitor RaiA [Muribaculaceae bacterium]
MEITIRANHFEMAEKLEAFTNKKLEKLARRYDTISEISVNYKLVKPETAMNKEAGVKVNVPNAAEIFASKTADTFEEALDLALEAVERQLERTKKP